jgi:hypothetical protein
MSLECERDSASAATRRSRSAAMTALSLGPALSAALTAWHWRFQSNQGVVSNVLARLEGSGLAPEKVLAQANVMQMHFDQAIDLVTKLPALGNALAALARTASTTPEARGARSGAVEQLLSEAAKYDAYRTLAPIKQDFLRFTRALDADSLEGEGGARELYLRILEQSRQVLTDKPGTLASAANDYALAAEFLFRDETEARRFSVGADSVLRERTPGAGPSVTQRRLGKVSELMAQYRVPEDFRGVTQQARLLDDIGIFFRQDRGRFMTQGTVVPADVSDGTFSPAELMQRFASLSNYIDHVKNNPAKWSEVANHRLNKEIIFSGLQKQANNGGVMLPEQMREIERETDPFRRLYLFREAAKGIDRLNADWSDLYLNVPSPLNPDRPRYEPLVSYYRSVSPNQRIDTSGEDFDGMGALLGGNSGITPRMPSRASMSRSMDFVAQIERQVVLEGRSPPDGSVHRNAIALVDERIAQMRAQQSLPTTGAQGRSDIDLELRVLENLKGRINQDLSRQR